MTGTPSPFTPCPDPVSRSGEEPAGGPAPDEPPATPGLSTASSDEIGLLLSQPTPDPYLREAAGGSESCTAEGAGSTPGEHGPGGAVSESPAGAAFAVSEVDSVLPIRLSSEERPQPDFLNRSPLSSSSDDGSLEDHRPGISWPFILVSSYASALTLALLWMFWTGRSLARPAPSSVPGPPAAVGRRLEAPVIDRTPPAASLPESRLTTLGQPLRLGDIEVVPRSVSYQAVELVRLVGETDDRRETEPALRLTIQIRNLSGHDIFAPLDEPLVRDPAPGPDQPCLELAGGRRVPLYRLAPESEWSIAGQEFPTLSPGDAIETILFTEPIPMSALAEPMIWHVKVRTGPFQTDVVGVRFSARDIEVIEAADPEPSLRPAE